MYKVANALFPHCFHNWFIHSSLVYKLHTLFNSDNNIPIMKANKMHYFSNLFDKVLYMFRTGPLSIIRSILTLYTQQ